MTTGEDPESVSEPPPESRKMSFEIPESEEAGSVLGDPFSPIPDVNELLRERQMDDPDTLRILKEMAIFTVLDLSQKSVEDLLQVCGGIIMARPFSRRVEPSVFFHAPLPHHPTRKAPQSIGGIRI